MFDWVLLHNNFCIYYFPKIRNFIVVPVKVVKHTCIHTHTHTHTHIHTHTSTHLVVTTNTHIYARKINNNNFQK